MYYEFKAYLCIFLYFYAKHCAHRMGFCVFARTMLPMILLLPFIRRRKNGYVVCAYCFIMSYIQCNIDRGRVVNTYSMPLHSLLNTSYLFIWTPWFGCTMYIYNILLCMYMSKWFHTAFFIYPVNATDFHRMSNASRNQILTDKIMTMHTVRHTEGRFFKIQLETKAADIHISKHYKPFTKAQRETHIEMERRRRRKKRTSNAKCLKHFSHFIILFFFVFRSDANYKVSRKWLNETKANEMAFGRILCDRIWVELIAKKKWGTTQQNEIHFWYSEHSDAQKLTLLWSVFPSQAGQKKIQSNLRHLSCDVCVFFFFFKYRNWTSFQWELFISMSVSRWAYNCFFIGRF